MFITFYIRKAPEVTIWLLIFKNLPGGHVPAPPLDWLCTTVLAMSKSWPDHFTNASYTSGVDGGEGTWLIAGMSVATRRWTHHSPTRQKVTLMPSTAFPNSGESLPISPPGVRVPQYDNGGRVACGSWRRRFNLIGQSASTAYSSRHFLKRKHQTRVHSELNSGHLCFSPNLDAQTTLKASRELL